MLCHPRSMSQSHSAEYFDEWYANMGSIGPRDEIVQRHLGLPSHLLSTSLLSWDGIAEVVDALQLEPGALLLDLACGRGGYGLEIAARTNARFVGVDFSAEAIRQAIENAKRSGAPAEFRVGELAATRLPPASVDAAVCVDAIQFSADAQSYAEIRRVLVPGGRVVLTTWEARYCTDERVPEKIRVSTRWLICLLPASRTSRYRTESSGGPPSGQCGRRPQHSSLATTPTSGRYTTKASVCWRSSISSVGCSPQQPHRERHDGPQRGIPPCTVEAVRL